MWKELIVKAAFITVLGVGVWCALMPPLKQVYMMAVWAWRRRRIDRLGEQSRVRKITGEKRDN